MLGSIRGDLGEGGGIIEGKKNWEKMANECRELDKEKRRKDERSEQKKKRLGLQRS